MSQLQKSYFFEIASSLHSCNDSKDAICHCCELQPRAQRRGSEAIPFLEDFCNWLSLYIIKEKLCNRDVRAEGRR